MMITRRLARQMCMSFIFSSLITREFQSVVFCALFSDGPVVGEFVLAEIVHHTGGFTEDIDVSDLNLRLWGLHLVGDKGQRKAYAFSYNGLISAAGSRTWREAKSEETARGNTRSAHIKLPGKQFCL